MARGEYGAVEHRHGEVGRSGRLSAEGVDERKRDDVDDADCDHSRERTRRVEARALVDVLRHRAAERSVRKVDARVAQDEKRIRRVHVGGLRAVAPVGMRPERQRENNGGQRRAEGEPRTEPAPTRARLVGEKPDKRIVHRVPHARDEHQRRHGGHRDAEDVRVEEHEEVPHEHPREVASDVAEAVG